MLRNPQESMFSMDLRNSKKAFQNERFKFTSPLGKQILCAPKKYKKKN